MTSQVFLQYCTCLTTIPGPTPDPDREEETFEISPLYRSLMLLIEAYGVHFVWFFSNLMRIVTEIQIDYAFDSGTHLSLFYTILPLLSR